MMALTDHEEVRSGEQRLRTRRNAFWRFSLIGMAVALVLGFAGGFGMALVEEKVLPPPVSRLPFGGTDLGLLHIWFTVAYFRRVDELDSAR